MTSTSFTFSGQSKPDAKNAFFPLFALSLLNELLLTHRALTLSLFPFLHLIRTHLKTLYLPSDCLFFSLAFPMFVPPPLDDGLLRCDREKINFKSHANLLHTLFHSIFLPYEFLTYSPFLLTRLYSFVHSVAFCFFFSFSSFTFHFFMRSVAPFRAIRAQANCIPTPMINGRRTPHH